MSNNFVHAVIKGEVPIGEIKFVTSIGSTGNTTTLGLIKGTISSGVIRGKSKTYNSSGKLYNSHTLYNKHTVYYQARESGIAPQSIVSTI